MFILLTEDYEIFKAETISDDEIEAAEDGIISIINPDDMTRYVGDGEWHKIEEWDMAVHHTKRVFG
jgi:hypothetical protein